MSCVYQWHAQLNTVFFEVIYPSPFWSANWSLTVYSSNRVQLQREGIFLNTCPKYDLNRCCYTICTRFMPTLSSFLISAFAFFCISEIHQDNLPEDAMSFLCPRLWVAQYDSWYHCSVRQQFYGGLIESHTWSIEPRLFQWPWRTPYPDLKVRPFFDVKYLENGCRYGHSYYGRRIGNRTQGFEWHQFQYLERPLSQFSRSRYYSTSNNSQMVQDRAIVTMAD